MSKLIYKKLLSISLYLFPEYTSAKVSKKGKVIFKKNKFIPFIGRKAISIYDLLSYYIPIQISLNKWQSEDWYYGFINEWFDGENINLEDIVEFLYKESTKISILNTNFLVCRVREFVIGKGMIEKKENKILTLQNITEDIFDDSRIFWRKELLKYIAVKTVAWSLIIYLNFRPLLQNMNLSNLLMNNSLITEIKASLFYIKI